MFRYAFRSNEQTPTELHTYIFRRSISKQVSPYDIQKTKEVFVIAIRHAELIFVSFVIIILFCLIMNEYIFLGYPSISK